LIVVVTKAPVTSNANLTRNTVRFGDARPTTILARPTPTQTRAFNLLGLKIAA
jgi:hypothetical protein